MAMKKIVFSLMFLISIVSASASYFPQPGIIFEFKGAECFSNGSILLNLTHEGNTVAFSRINLTAESEELSPQPLFGEWLIGGYPAVNYDYPAGNYTGNNFFGKTRFKFKTTNNIFTKGEYIVTLSWPSNSLYQDKIKFAVECPGIICNSDDDCINQQQCLNQTCEWVKCAPDQFATGHTCLPRCNDYDFCTKDYFIDGRCVYEKIENCIVQNKTAVQQKEQETDNIFIRFWKWLKSRYE